MSTKNNPKLTAQQVQDNLMHIYGANSVNNPETHGSAHQMEFIVPIADKKNLDALKSDLAKLGIQANIKSQNINKGFAGYSFDDAKPEKADAYVLRAEIPDAKLLKVNELANAPVKNETTKNTFLGMTTSKISTDISAYGAEGKNALTQKTSTNLIGQDLIETELHVNNNNGPVTLTANSETKTISVKINDSLNDEKTEATASSAIVTDALQQAINRAKKDGISPLEKKQIHEIAQMAAEDIKYDNNFDPQLEKDLAAKAAKIAPAQGHAPAKGAGKH